MRRLLFAALIVAFSSAGHAQNRMVISDIDDTLKMSHVLDTTEALKNAALSWNEFVGMSDLFDSLDREQNLSFEYVTNAPQDLMEAFHTLFLLVNQFPQGRLHLNPDLFSQTFKVEKIHEILDEKRPTEVLLIGDNGERDIEVYEQIRRDYPRIKFTIFIHQVYSSKNSDETGKLLLPGQIGFVTSLDAAVVLAQQGWLSPAGRDRVLRLLPKFLKEKKSPDDDESAFIPAWMDCSDYQGVLNSREKTLATLSSKIQNRCRPSRWYNPLTWR